MLKFVEENSTPREARRSAFRDIADDFQPPLRPSSFSSLLLQYAGPIKKFKGRAAEERKLQLEDLEAARVPLDSFPLSPSEIHIGLGLRRRAEEEVKFCCVFAQDCHVMVRDLALALAGLQLEVNLVLISVTLDEQEVQQNMRLLLQARLQSVKIVRGKFGREIWQSVGKAIQSGLARCISLEYTLMEEYLSDLIVSNVTSARQVEAVTLKSCLTPTMVNGNTIERLSSLFLGGSSLTRLNLTSNSLKDETVNQFCLRGLNAKQSFITSINLADNLLTDIAATQLGTSLRTFNKTLKHLDLSGNMIGEQGAKMLASAIILNQSLVRLDLSVNWIQDEGASAFANALKRNASLKELRLSSNGITSSGAVSMAQALQNNTSLQVLDLDKNTIDRKGQEELVQVVYNQNKTLYSLLINAHAVGINLRIPTWRQEQEKKTREFGTRILEKRRSALQEKEEEERRRREEEEQKARENTLNLPESFSLERALLELDNLFVKFCSLGTGFSGQGKRSTSMDFLEFTNMLAEMRIIPREKGGVGHLSKTVAANIFKKANKSSAKDDDTSEMNMEEFRVSRVAKPYTADGNPPHQQEAMDLIAKELEKESRTQLLFLEPATSVPPEPASPVVKQRKYLVSKPKREIKKPKPPETLLQVFIKFSAGDGTQVGKRTKSMDMNEWFKALDFLEILPREKGARSRVTRSEATSIFKRANQGPDADSDSREMDKGEFFKALHILAKQLGVTAESDEDLNVLIPAKYREHEELPP